MKSGIHDVEAIPSIHVMYLIHPPTCHTFHIGYPAYLHFIIIFSTDDYFFLHPFFIPWWTMQSYPSDYPSPSKEVFLPAGEEEKENASEAHHILHPIISF